ncbi:TPA: hypothetical protein N2743_001221 [Vibrio parahaemolyticus]|nr:hypothetical protein [Vibrio parahaemolyticus]
MFRLLVLLFTILLSCNSFAYWQQKTSIDGYKTFEEGEDCPTAAKRHFANNFAQYDYAKLSICEYSHGTNYRMNIQWYNWIDDPSTTDDDCSTIPSYPDGICTPTEPEPPSCDDPDLQKEIQHAHHACQLSMPESEFFSNVFRWWCENGDVYTYCGLEPKNCIQGLTCTRPDDDVVLCNPNTQECTLPEPDPEDPDNPQNETNNYLGNIHSTLDDFRDKQLLDNQLYKQWQQHMLGQMREVNNSLRNGIGGGGAGGVAAAVGEGNLKLSAIGETLEDIKCELSEGCEGQESPTANINCEQNIFECQGDVIQCANLKLQFEDFCPAQELAELESEANRVFGDDRTGELVESDVLNFGNIDSQYLSNGVSFGNSTCPSPHTFTFTHFAGTTSVEVSYEPACEYARAAAPIHIVLAWIAGLFLIGRTQGAF